MKIRFIKNKDNFTKGQTLEIDQSEFMYQYWMKKGCIENIESNPKNRTASLNSKKSKVRVKK